MGPPKLSRPIQINLPTFWSQVDVGITESLQRSFGFSDGIADALGQIIGWIVQHLTQGVLEFPLTQLVADVIENNLDEIIAKILDIMVPLDSSKPGGKPDHFQDVWWKGLPMDHSINYALLPVRF